MAIRFKRGMGDAVADAATAASDVAMASASGLFDPSCTPGSPGCVPHWYCYIPLMATPDCLASFGQGVKEIGGVVGSTVGGAVGSAIGGAVQGTVQGIANPQGADGGTPSSSTNWALYVGLAAAAAFALVAFSGGSPRRYGR